MVGNIDIVVVARTTARLLPGIVLLVSGLGKVVNFRWFVGAMAKYRLITPQAVAVSAASIVIAEIALGAAMVLSRGEPLAGYAAACLLALFAIVTSISIIRTSVVVEDCGCFKASCGSAPSWWHCARNLSLAIMAVLSAPTSDGVVMPLAVACTLLVVIATIARDASSTGRASHRHEAPSM
jgi:hypothetical protein